MAELLPTLPGMVDGIVGHDLLGWTVQCADCHDTVTAPKIWQAIQDRGMRFHPWPDGTNPRLCRACRLARGCDCHGCECERQGTSYPRRAA